MAVLRTDPWLGSFLCIPTNSPRCPALHLKGVDPYLMTPEVSLHSPGQEQDQEKASDKAKGGRARVYVSYLISNVVIFRVLKEHSRISGMVLVVWVDSGLVRLILSHHWKEPAGREETRIPEHSQETYPKG